MFDHQFDEWENWEQAEDDAWLSSLGDDDPSWKAFIRVKPTLRDRINGIVERYGKWLLLGTFAILALLSRLVIDYGAVANAMGRVIGNLVGYSKR